MKFTKHQIENSIKECKSMASAAKLLNINYKTFRTYAKHYNVFIPNQAGKGVAKNRVEIEDVLSNKVKFSNVQLKKRLVDENLIKNECCECKNVGVWMNQLLTLELDHIDGNKLNNNLKNLRLLCPNCHSQTSTFRKKKSALVLKLVDRLV